MSNEQRALLWNSNEDSETSVEPSMCQEVIGAPDTSNDIPILIFCYFDILIHVDDSSNILVFQHLEIFSSNNLVFRPTSAIHALSHPNNRISCLHCQKPYICPVFFLYLPVVTFTFCTDVRKPRGKG